MRNRYNQYTQQVPNQFGSLSYNNSIIEKPGIPVDQIARTSAILDQQYKRNRQLGSQLQTAAKLDKMKVRDEDNGIIDMQIQEVDSSLKEMSANKNYHRMGNELVGLYQEYQTNVPRLKAIEANQKKMAFQKELNENENYTQDEIANIMRVSYDEAIEVDENGNYVGGGFSRYKAAEKVNANDVLKDNMSDFNKYVDSYDGVTMDANGNMQIAGYTMTEDGYFLKDPSMSRKGKDLQDVADAINGILSQDTGYQAWLDTKYHIENYDPETRSYNYDKQDLIQGFYHDAAIVAGKDASKEKVDQAAKDAYLGTFQKIRSRYPEASDEAINNIIHKKMYKDSQIQNVIRNRSGYYTYEQIAYDFDGFVDSRNARWDAEVERYSDFEIDMYPGVSSDRSLNIDKQYEKVDDMNARLDEVSSSIENTESNLHELEDKDEGNSERAIRLRESLQGLRNNKATIEGDRDNIKRIIDNVTNSVTNDQILDMVSIGNYKKLINDLDSSQKNELAEIIRDKDEAKLLEFYDELGFELINQTGKTSSERSETMQVYNPKKGTIYATDATNVFRKFTNNIPEEKLKYYENLHIYAPANEEMQSYKTLDRTIEGIKTGQVGYVTDDGRTNRDEELIAKFDNAVDVKGVYASKHKDGTMYMQLTLDYGEDGYDGKQKEVMLIKPTNEPHTTAMRLSNEMRLSARNNAYTPAHKNKLLQHALNIEVGNYPTANNSNLSEELSRLKSQVWRAGANNKSDKIQIELGANLLPLYISKTSEGGYKVNVPQYDEEGNLKTDSNGDLIFNNIVKDKTYTDPIASYRDLKAYINDISN